MHSIIPEIYMQGLGKHTKHTSTASVLIETHTMHLGNKSTTTTT